MNNYELFKPDIEIRVSLLLIRKLGGKIYVLLNSLEDDDPIPNNYYTPNKTLQRDQTFTVCAEKIVSSLGITVTNLKFLKIFNHVSQHMIEVGMTAELFKGEPSTIRWNWYRIDNLPTNLPKMTVSSIQAFCTGQTFFE